MSQGNVYETDRLAALRRYDILETFPEVAFERVTRLAARLFRTPIALVSLVDANRVWFKSRFGLQFRQTVRHGSFCDAVVRDDEILVVPDAQEDDRFRDYSLVSQETGIRFYAGAPLSTLDRHRLGTLCIMDVHPRRNFIYEQQRTLADLAAITVDEMELRIASRWASPKQSTDRNWEPSERRLETKVSVKLLGARPQSHTGYLLDLSDSGIGIIADAAAPPGVGVEIAGNGLAVRGEVAYCHPVREGFQLGISRLQVMTTELASEHG